MRRLFSAFIVLWAGAALCAGVGEEREPSEGGKGWGTVVGQVRFEGNLDDPALKPYRDGVSIRQLVTLQQASQGVVGRIIGYVFNESLIIDPKTLGVKNAFVYLKHKPDRVHPVFQLGNKLPPVELISRVDPGYLGAPGYLGEGEKEYGQTFFPRAIILRVGQTLRLVSKEASIHISSTAKDFNNPSFSIMVNREKVRDITLSKPETRPMPLGSNLSPAAHAWCLVLDHPYAVLTQADGSFRLENLPEGENELVIWHEAVGYVSEKLTITATADKVKKVQPQTITAKQLGHKKPPW